MDYNNAVNAIRILAVDAVQQANSGHPGFPLGAAPIMYELFSNQMNHTSKDSKWFNRDRFILSAGHGSAMLYATLHLFGYKDTTIEDLKNFRQFGSLTPGHPEYKHTDGVEATTGPLGAGMGMAVGMAMAEAHLASVFNKDDIKPIDHYTFALGGEGCFMEGISSEVFSLAGTLGLGKLIILFDCNNITIEGSVDLAFTEDLEKRMEAFGFQTLVVEDGTDPDKIGEAIAQAKAETSKPSFIKICTAIGYGVPDREGTAKAHGEPIGEPNMPILRENLNWPYEERFFVPDEIYDGYKQIADGKANTKDEWDELFADYKGKYPEEAKLLESYISGEVPAELFEGDYLNFEPKSDASRSISGKVLNELAGKVTNLIGGSADLAPSNKTEMKEMGFFSATDREGRNIHFGVREMGMTAIGNGIMLHGGLKAFVASFFVFSDYMKPMLRLSALMGLPLISILTHDSIGVGEDGPTHQPIEQLSMLRAMPNINVFRPADEFETRIAWKQALLSSDTPSVFVLSRQNLDVLDGSGVGAEKGAYVVGKESATSIDAIILSSGSEVGISIKAKEELEKEGLSIRVVSVPCMEIFNSQSKEYKDEILPPSVTKRLSVEAGSSMPWGKYVGIEGGSIAMDRFGASAPAAKLFEAFGFTVDNIVAKVKEL